MKYEKVRKLICGGMLLAMMLATAGCGGGQTPSASEDGAEVVKSVSEEGTKEVTEGREKTSEKLKITGQEMGEAEIQALSNSSMQLFRETVLGETNAEKNVLISPYSLITALGMTENGASGETLTGMQNAISGGLETDTLNRILYSSLEKMKASEDISFHSANSIWVKNDNDITLKDTFVEKVYGFYGAEIFESAFDEATKEDINQWVSEKTNKMIPSIVDEISEETLMYLINAIAFEGSWEEVYEEYCIEENRDFTNASGEKEQVTMLRSNEPYYVTLNGGTGFVKYYKGGEYAFVGILPQEGMSVAEYVEGLEKEENDFAKAFQNKKDDKIVKVWMPEFSYDYDTEMSEILTKLGMEKAFSDEAEFTEMVTEDSVSVKIDKVIHKTHIEVDRFGTRAAAATVVEMRCTEAAPVEKEVLEITLDRPFVYGIVDTSTGLPVFIGCVNSVQ